MGRCCLREAAGRLERRRDLGEHGGAEDGVGSARGDEDRFGSAEGGGAMVMR